MRNRPNSSPPSAPCRLEWRPSRWLLGALGALLPLAIASVWLAGLRWPEQALLSAVAAGWGGIAIARQARRRPIPVVVPWTAAPVSIDGEAVAEFAVRWRGPLATLGWRRRDGRRGHLQFWPDTLPAAQRRELRLAADARAVSAQAARMAP